jgi:hypothetical protein
MALRRRIAQLNAERDVHVAGMPRSCQFAFPATREGMLIIALGGFTSVTCSGPIVYPWPAEGFPIFAILATFELQTAIS